MKPTAPCQDCEKRHPGCHGKCSDYISFKEENEALREKTRAEKAVRCSNRYYSEKKTLTRMLSQNRNFSG